MKVSKESLGLGLVYVVSGVLTGLMFGKSQYYKGQSDAYDDITVDLKNMQEELEEYVTGSKSEGSQ